jgi:flagellar biosynthesis protein FliR
MSSWLLNQWGLTALLGGRVLGLAWTAPGLSTSGLGGRARFVFVVLVTACVAPGIRSSVPVAGALAEVARLFIVEVAVGALLGVSAGLIVAAARQGGELVGAQAGLSAAALINPETGEGMTPMGHFYGLLALGVFVALDGPLQLITGITRSYSAIPVGGLTLSETSVGDLFFRVASALELALQIAAPAALALMVAGLAVGFMARTAPSFQFMNFSLSIRAVAALVIVFAGLVPLAAMLATAWRLVL